MKTTEGKSRFMRFIPLLISFYAFFAAAPAVLAVAVPVQPGEVLISLTHEDYMDDQEFGLVMSVPDTASGCYALSPLSYNARFIGAMMLEIEVGAFTRTITETNNPHYDCSTGYNVVRTVIPLDKSDLMKRGTKKIKFKSPLIAETYNLTFSENGVVLTPTTAVYFKPANKMGRVFLNLSDKDSVLLSVPQARGGEDFSEALKVYALEQGAQLPDAPYAQDGSSSLVVYDPEGVFRDRMTGRGMVEVGEVLVDRVVRGAQGDRPAQIPLSVYARPL